ncbi:MAG TPA: bifunctional oligoribonuclease/PAP phosphatase NrnA [Actinomycetota bacterium]|nr:bifunctional oligoribonuclease/PAP phosphatase NrnA [Actinomycetota bacterium]
MRYDAPDWDRTLAALRSTRDIALACHINPDGDALGSLLGAALGLRQLGKRVYPTWGAAPVKIPFGYSFLPGAAMLVQPDKLPIADTFLALDCGAGDRLGAVETQARACRTLINVDHHPGNDEFGQLNIVVTTASSTSELVAWLLRDLGVQLDRDIATCLYAGIVTDTGRFQYANSTPDTLRLAADLLACGVDAPAIAQEVFESSPFGYLKLVGHVLERAKLFEGERFVYSWITLSDLEETGVAMDETEKLIDLIRSTRAADVAALFKQQPDGAYRVSMRSKGPRSVGAIARKHGGGGHELAAGFSAPDVEQTVDAIRAELRESA